MKVSRRGLFGLLARLPLVGSLVPVQLEVIETSPKLADILTKHGWVLGENTTEDGLELFARSMAANAFMRNRQPPRA